MLVTEWHRLFTGNPNPRCVWRPKDCKCPESENENISGQKAAFGYRVLWNIDNRTGLYRPNRLWSD